LAQAPGELSAYVMLARAKLLEKDAKSAEEALKKACDQLPKSPDAHRLLGEFYVDQTRMSEAGDQFRRALELDARNGPALMNLARIQLASGDKQAAEQSLKRLATFDGYKSTYATFLFQEGQRDLALREFERLAKESPNDRTARTNLIIAYRAQGRLSDVDRVLAETLKKNPKDTQALLQRGETSIEAAKYAQAEIDLNEVLRQTPSSPEVHYLLAKLHQAKGDTLTYRQELSQALQLNRNLQPIRVELAQNLINNKQPKAALDVLDEAPEAQKASTPILVQRNWALWALGDMAEMRKGIDRGLAEQRTTQLLIQDGLYKLRTGDATGARKVLEEALAINPSDLLALRALNQSYQALKDAPLAVAKVKEYAALRPKSPEVQEFLGELLSSSGDRAGARAAFTASQTASPGFVPAALAQVRLDVMDGQWDVARTRLQAIPNLDDPGNTTARMWLAVIEEIRGDNAKAAEDYRRVTDGCFNLIRIRPRQRITWRIFWCEIVRAWTKP
jgi:cellulose synthase operon protein C